MENTEVSQLHELVTTLEAQNKIKTDIVVPAGHIRYSESTAGLIVSDKKYTITELAHEQISEKLGIPIGYYRKLKTEAPDILEQNINGWLGKKSQTKYLLRTFSYSEAGIDNVCRAMLSNRYNILDNYDVLFVALKAIKEAGVNVKIQEAKVTEKRMYLHIVAPEIEIEANELLKDYIGRKDRQGIGNGIISGLSISNSEVGMGTFEICPKAMILKCLNGAIDRSAAVKRVHLGAKMDESVVTWSQGTRNKNYELIMEMTKDAVKTFLSKDYLGNFVNRLERAKGIEIQNPEGIVEHLSKDMGIVDDSQRSSILRHFLGDGDTSGLGVINAITRVAQDQTPDMRYLMESQAFQYIDKLKQFDKPLSRN